MNEAIKLLSCGYCITPVDSAFSWIWRIAMEVRLVYPDGDFMPHLMGKYSPVRCTLPWIFNIPMEPAPYNCGAVNTLSTVSLDTPPPTVCISEIRNKSSKVSQTPYPHGREMLSKGTYEHQ